MSQDEITVMDGSKCIFQLRGVRPFLSDKFDITKHKNYKLLEDYDKKNLFDIESYMKRRGKAKLNKNTVIMKLQLLDIICIWYNNQREIHKEETLLNDKELIGKVHSSMYHQLKKRLCYGGGCLDGFGNTFKDRL